MQIDLVAVGRRMPDWVETAVNEYRKRLPKTIQFRLVEITPATRSKNNNADNFKQQEQKRIDAALSANTRLIVLDEKGKSVSSQSLATQLQSWIDEQQHISIVIGGADGLSDEIKNRADQMWSLSAMTLPHGLVRVMMLEQLYRAWTITQNHPYHRE